jgi:hypothetical protein
MLRSLISSFTALLTLAAAGGPAALAQTPSLAPSSSGAYASLSPGNQKVARALFEAQTTKFLTLDEIAARKQSGGGGWDKVVNDMKARGLVQAKNLGRVVSRHQYARKGETVTASGRRFDDGSHGSRGRGQARDDGDKQGYGKHDGKQESGRGQTYASGSGRSGSAYSAVRSGGNAGNSGRGGQ